MIRKTFSYPLKDNKSYEFTERNREDIELAHLQNEVRKSKIQFAKENVLPIDKELFEAIVITQMDRIYPFSEVLLHIESHPEEIYKFVYASFRIKNDNVSFEKFKELIDAPLAKNLLKKIDEIEKPDPSSDLEVAEVLGLPVKNKVSPLMVKWAKEQPEVYSWLKHNVKKKE